MLQGHINSQEQVSKKVPSSFQAIVNLLSKPGTDRTISFRGAPGSNVARGAGRFGGPRAGKAAGAPPPPVNRGGMPVTMEVDRTRSFDRSSPVHAYWLARCEGFEVRSGKEYGVVEDVTLDSASQALYLTVKFGLARRREVAADAVESVVPAEELLVLEGAPEPPPRVAPAARKAANLGRSGAEAGAKASLGAASRAAQATAVAGAAAWSGTRRSAVATGRGSRSLSVRLAPRVVSALRLAGWAIYAGLAWTAV